MNYEKTLAGVLDRVTLGVLAYCALYTEICVICVVQFCVLIFKVFSCLSQIIAGTHTHLTDCCTWTTNVSVTAVAGLEVITGRRKSSRGVQWWRSAGKAPEADTRHFFKITIASIVSRDHCVNID